MLGALLEDFMETHGGKYNIKAISKIVGIQPGTLRAWERRYKMIAPIRNESGHRLYTEDHVKIIKWLIDQVDKGFTISQAVALLENEKFSPPLTEELVENGDLSQAFVLELLDALLSFNENSGNEIMNRAFSIYTIDKVVIDILGNLLVNIGNLREVGKITSAHEHFATSFLRTRIGMIIHSTPAISVYPKAIAVCGPNECHELGLLIFTHYIRRLGFEVIYLGTSISDNDFDIVFEQVKPKYLFLSCTLEENKSSTLSLVDRLSVQQPRLTIGVSGHGVSKLTCDEKHQYQTYIVGDTKKQWDQWLGDKLSH